MRYFKSKFKLKYFLSLWSWGLGDLPHDLFIVCVNSSTSTSCSASSLLISILIIYCLHPNVDIGNLRNIQKDYLTFL